MTARLTSWLRKAARGALLPLAVLGLWWLAARHSVVIPSIASVMDVLAHPFCEPPALDSTSLASGVAVSLLRVVLGFGLAAASGIPIGLLIGRCRAVNEMLSPSIAALMVISPVAWLPVTILVFGLSSPAAACFGDNAWQHGLLDQLRFAVLAVIWMSAFFPVALNTAAGVRGVREAHVEAARVLGASPGQLIRKIILPGAAPSILTGLRLGAGVAWRVIIAAEIFPGTRSGLGYMIVTAQEQGRYEYAFAAIVIIGVIGLALDGLLRAAAWPLGRWQAAQR